MVINTISVKIEAVELFKTIKKIKSNGIRKYNMKIIEDTLNKGTSMKKAKKKLDIGREQHYALKDERGQITIMR